MKIGLNAFVEAAKAEPNAPVPDPGSGIKARDIPYHSMRERNGGRPIYVENAEMVREAIKAHGRYISSSELPFFDGRGTFPASLLRAFIWGPAGEWTGMARTSHFPDENDRGYPGDIIDVYNCMEVRVDCVDSAGYDRNDDCRMMMAPISSLRSAATTYYHHDRDDGSRYKVLSFATYESQAIWAAFCFEHAHDRYDLRLKQEDLFGEEIVSNLIPLDVDRLAFEQWTSALTWGSYAGGVGVLRDDDNRYDPLGVLADINEAPWEWNPHEGAYTIDGDAVMLSPRRLGDYLHVDPRSKALVQFATGLARTFDAGWSLEEIGRGLVAARTKAKPRTKLLRDSLERTYGFRDRFEETYYHKDHIIGIDLGSERDFSVVEFHRPSKWLV